MSVMSNVLIMSKDIHTFLDTVSYKFDSLRHKNLKEPVRFEIM